MNPRIVTGSRLDEQLCVGEQSGVSATVEGAVLTSASPATSSAGALSAAKTAPRGVRVEGVLGGERRR